MEKKFRFGILGLGRGRVPLINLNMMKDYVQVAGVVEQNEATVAECRENGWLKDDVPLYRSFEELLKAGLDAVILCDYFHTHCRFAIKAFNAGVKAVFSETTAAPSLGECVDLVETAEKTGGKYMLMASTSYFMALLQAKAQMKSSDFGDLIYAEAEYIHPSPPEMVSPLDPEQLHWRNTLPSCYYNMHTLGPLMYATGSMPKKVLAKAAVHERHIGKANNTPKIFSLTEMDNGAVFNTTGCVGTGTQSKWYRFAFERGTMETERNIDEPQNLICVGIKTDTLKTITPKWDTCGAISPADMEEYGEMIRHGGHGGCDSVLFLDMLKYLKNDVEPFWNIYRATALSAAGILSWYSVLNGCKEYDIPDFSKKEDRDKVRGDYRKPFADRLADLTLPCSLEEE